MKKILYTAIIFIALLFASCEVEESAAGGHRTIQGYMAFTNVHVMTDDYIHALELASRVNYYAQANAEQKDLVKKLYLADYLITQEGNKWELSNSIVKWTLVHNGLSLDETNAKWKVQVDVNLHLNYGDDKLTHIEMFPPNAFVVTNKGNRQFQLDINSVKAGISDIVLSRDQYENYMYYGNSYKTIWSSSILVSAIQTSTKTYNLNDYTLVSGTGFTSTGLKLDYVLKEPVVIEGTSLSYITERKSGKMSMEVQKSSSSVKDKVEAVISPLYVTITMNGVTEDYRRD